MGGRSVALFQEHFFCGCADLNFSVWQLAGLVPLESLESLIDGQLFIFGQNEDRCVPVMHLTKAWNQSSLPVDCYSM